MEHANPTQVLAAACPEARLRDPSTLPHEHLEVRWECDNTVADHICHEISVGDEDRCLLGYYPMKAQRRFDCAPIAECRRTRGSSPTNSARSLVRCAR